MYKAEVQFSIIDAVRTILLLDNQDFDTNKIKTILYGQVFMPFFIVPLIVMIFLFTSASSRFFNKAMFISLASFATLVIWGIMFLLQKLALGGIVQSEIGMLLPLAVLFGFMQYIFRKKADE